MKRCSKCKQEKPSEEFYPSPTLKSGLTSSCRQCNHDWYRANAGKRRDYDRKRKYGASPEDIEFTFGSQGRCCGICGSETPNGRSPQWHIDHDHQTKKFRGVLCVYCNWLLGNARDSIQILQNAIDYLGGKKNVICQ